MIRAKAIAVRRAHLLLDALVLSLSFFLALLLRQYLPNILENWEIIGTDVIQAFTPGTFTAYLPLILIVVPLWCGFLYLNGMYDYPQTRSLLEVVWITSKTALYVALGLATLIFAFQLKFVSRLFFVLYVGVSFVAVLTEKIIVSSAMQRTRTNGVNSIRLLIVGTGRRAASLIGRIKKHPEWGLKIVGVLDDEPGRGLYHVEGTSIIGNLDDISEIIKTNAVDEVAFVVPRSRLNSIVAGVLACETVGVKARVAMDLFDLKIAKAKHTDLDGLPFVSFETTVGSESQILIKRMFDVVLSGVGLIALLPFFLIIAVSIKLSSAGPPLFKQRRVGLNGREFLLYKFRTMYQGADKERAKLSNVNEMDGPVFKMRRDPRITPLGKILRKFSIDELPQLYNVLVGHMSLIGPRALPTYEVERLDPWQRRRQSMRPGITCLWQVNGRNNVGFEDWLRYDLEYLDNWSLWLDLKILIKTVPVVIFGIGAY